MYLKKVTTLTTTKEVQKTFSWRYGNHGSHVERTNPTPEDVKRYNEYLSEQKLRWLLNKNFHPGDWHIVLTYKKNVRPSPEESKKVLDAFMGRMKYRYKKSGRPFRWVLVTEYKNKGIHHHLILNDVPEVLEYVRQSWPHGRPHFTRLDESNDYAALAHYLIKETRKTFREKAGPHRQRYSHSRNLEIPKTKVTIIRAAEWRKEPRAPKGWYIVKDSIRNGVSKLTGYPYQRYTLAMAGVPPGEYDFEEGG